MASILIPQWEHSDPSLLDPIDTDLAKVFQLHRVPPLGIKFFLSCESLAALLLDGVSHPESQDQPSVSTLHSACHLGFNEYLSGRAL